MRKTIIIIDTDKNMADLIKSTLEFQDFNVVIPKNPADIKHVLKSKNIDLVIADIMIDKINMLKLAKSMRKQCPVIMTGIKDLLSEERRLLFCENIPFLQKPISPNMLFEKVREMVS